MIEAKAKTGNTKSSKTILKHHEHYGKTKLIKIGDYNISEEGDIITIPHYMTFVLGKDLYDFQYVLYCKTYQKGYMSTWLI